jgi:predicted small lipoprotein YifL
LPAVQEIVVTKPVNPSRRLLLPAAIAVLFALAGCGIKGPLELPTDAQVKGGEGKGKGEMPVARRLPGYEPSQQERKEARQLGRPIKPDEPFFLDPLLK